VDVKFVVSSTPEKERRIRAEIRVELGGVLDDDGGS
jgi:hypothetical protein